MMKTFKWTVVDVDREGSMFGVKYEVGEKSTVLYLPMKSAGKTLEQVIEGYMPKWLGENQQDLEVHVGQTGELTQTQIPQDLPKMYGSWAEEDIRAMIYDVFQQMKNEEV